MQKKESCQRWKSLQTHIENYKGMARICRGGVRNAKAQLKLKLARDVKKYKKGSSDMQITIKIIRKILA